MSLRALFIANAIMILFVGLVILQSFGGMNSDNIIDKMQLSDYVEKAPGSGHTNFTGNDGASTYR